MIENNVTMSEWEWEGILNTPERQKAAAKRTAADTGKQERLSEFHRHCAERLKKRLEISACRYATGAVGAGVAAYFAGDIAWLTLVLWGIALVAGLIAAYGFGKACGIACK
jgi:fatty acid desaturase